MRNWRVVTAVAAVVLAVAAAILAYAYLNRADQRAKQKVEEVDVLRAKNVIPKGTTSAEALGNGLVEVAQVPRNVRPSTALTQKSDLKTGLVAASAVAKGQFIVSDSFVAPSAITGFSGSLPKGTEAITITVDDTHGVAGFVVPNDTVNVLWSGDVEQVSGNAPPKFGADRTTGFLIPGVKVLAVGTTTATTPPPASATDSNGTTSTTAASSSSSVSRGLITLQVTPRQALQIAAASDRNPSGLYLSLNPPGFSTKTFTIPAEIVRTWNLFDQDLGTVRDFRQTAPPG